MDSLGYARELFKSGDTSEALGVIEDELESSVDSRAVWHQYFEFCRRSGEIDRLVAFVLLVLPDVKQPDTTFIAMCEHLEMHRYHDESYLIVAAIDRLLPRNRLIRNHLFNQKQIWQSFNPSEVYEEYRRWNEEMIRPISKLHDRPAVNQTPDRPLRLGFVSRDFEHGHSMRQFLASWFMGAKQSENNFVLYSQSLEPTGVDEYFESVADEIILVEETSGDESFAERILDDRIDVLIDFIGHMPGQRLLTYARRPAPIILGWAGYGLAPATETVDYFIADEIFLPRETVSNYIEGIAYMPDAAYAWVPPSDIPAIKPMRTDSLENVHFGIFNRYIKFTPEFVIAVATILSKTPNALLILKVGGIDSIDRRRLLSEFQASGLSEERLVFKDWTPYREHLDAYNDVDFLLDTFAHQGGATTLDAALMGVPTLTLCDSELIQHRGGLLINSNLGLSGLVAANVTDYVDLAIQLANHRDVFTRLRKKLRPRLLNSPLCDGSGFFERSQRLIRKIWQAYCAGRHPKIISLP
jgi:predicted O-linked N-acetylglucosamine transferase (SPINDLY family)